MTTFPFPCTWQYDSGVFCNPYLFMQTISIFLLLLIITDSQGYKPVCSKPSDPAMWSSNRKPKGHPLMQIQGWYDYTHKHNGWCRPIDQRHRNLIPYWDVIFQYRKSHTAYETSIKLSDLHNGISCTGKTTSLYWNDPLGLNSILRSAISKCISGTPFGCIPTIKLLDQYW